MGNHLWVVFKIVAYHYHVGTFGGVCNGVAALGQKAPDSLGIRFVLLAAISLYIGCGDGVPITPVSGDEVTIFKLLTQLFVGNDCGFIAHVDILPIILF